jgi:hypothetical protein
MFAIVSALLSLYMAICTSGRNGKLKQAVAVAPPTVMREIGNRRGCGSDSLLRDIIPYWLIPWVFG